MKSILQPQIRLSRAQQVEAAAHQVIAAMMSGRKLTVASYDETFSADVQRRVEELLEGARDDGDEQ